MLKDYVRYQVKSVPYPGITPLQGKSVKGLLYKHVTEEDVKSLHRFEGGEYEPHDVIVETEKGTKINAVAYLYLNPNNLEKK